MTIGWALSSYTHTHVLCRLALWVLEGTHGWEVTFLLSAFPNFGGPMTSTPATSKTGSEQPRAKTQRVS